MKTCSKCKLTKDLASFMKRKDSRDGYCGICRTCHSDRNKAWRLRNPDKNSKLTTKYNIRKAPYRAYKRDHCEKCNFIAEDTCQLHVDHIDGNHNNNNINNLQTLCANCHALKTKTKKDCGRKVTMPVYYRETLK